MLETSEKRTRGIVSGFVLTKKIKFVHETKSRVFFRVFTFSFQRLNGLFFSKDQKYCLENLSLPSAPSAILGALHFLNLQGNFSRLI